MIRTRLAAVALVALVGSLTGIAPAGQAAQESIGTALARSLRTSGVDASQTGAIALDRRTGEVVFSANADASLLPASAEKLAVSFTALHVLGPRFRFRTEALGAGTRSGTTWNGNVWLVGLGDPTLRLDDLDRLARRLAAMGIQRVAGRVFGDDSHFDARRDGAGWKSSYLGIESRPLSALSVAGAPLIGANGSAIAAARAFAHALAQRGIEVTGRAGTRPAPARAVVLARDTSVLLAKILRVVNAESDNFTAEMLLKELGATAARQGSSAAGARVVHTTLQQAGVPLEGVRIADGSGLSRFDRSTASTLAAILRTAAGDPSIRDVFVDSLAVAGISGTLERRLDTWPTRGRVIAKTGTTFRATALAGFVGRRYVFAILQNGSPVPYWTARVAQDRFVTVLARH